ncbi:MAG: ATP-binding protein, partial [Chloroflexi bacterium]|nr:ATP-binding protein [Chloroflexota bacterium]
LIRFDRDLVLEGGYTFAGYEPVDCPIVVRVNEYDDTGHLTRFTGGWTYHFTAAETGETVDVLVIASYFTDQGHKVCLAAIPEAFLPTWNKFVNECTRLFSALEPLPKVRIIGGRSDSFEPNVAWDDIVLPANIKDTLLSDVQSFFDKGISIYQRLKLKPFRKLLLAGVPGTGKTMLCSALAKWAIERDYLVIYVSSADYSGAAFWKIEEALQIAADSKLPALILLEELDAFVREEEQKALVLNVLDGAEARENDFGTLLIATTNYPEAIDERILKRPGRLDRVFIIPETRDHESAEKMLRHYMGAMWQDEHRVVVKDLVGYPGAFIREVAIHAMTQAAYNDLDAVPLDLLLQSLEHLLDQITARDDFLSRHRNNGFGFVIMAKS